MLKEGRWRPKDQEVKLPETKKVEPPPPRTAKQTKPENENWEPFTNPAVKKTQEPSNFDKSNPFMNFKTFDRPKTNMTFSKFGTTTSTSVPENPPTNPILPKTLSFNTHSGSTNNFDVFNSMAVAPIEHKVSSNSSQNLAFN